MLRSTLSILSLISLCICTPISNAYNLVDSIDYDTCTIITKANQRAIFDLENGNVIIPIHDSYYDNINSCGIDTATGFRYSVEYSSNTDAQTELYWKMYDSIINEHVAKYGIDNNTYYQWGFEICNPDIFVDTTSKNSIKLSVDSTHLLYSTKLSLISDTVNNRSIRELENQLKELGELSSTDTVKTKNFCNLIFTIQNDTLQSFQFNIQSDNEVLHLFVGPDNSPLLFLVFYKNSKRTFYCIDYLTGYLLNSKYSPYTQTND